MRYIAVDAPGGPESLQIAEGNIPQPGRGEILIRVEAAGVARADVLQRKGGYPPPPGASPILGLDCAGTIEALGEDVTQWRIGDRVCALLSGGGYAEYAVAPASNALPIPENWSAVEAASLPENAFTVYDNVFTRAQLRPHESLLVHGGTSGIGTTAIMFARALGSEVFATAGSSEKCSACVHLGALAAINYRTHDFVEDIEHLTGGRGVDVILDPVGGDYIARDVRALALDGRVACIATLLGRHVSVDLGMMLAKRATLLASSLRPRSPQQKAEIAKALHERIWPLLPAKDPIVPVIDSTFPLEQAAQAHFRIESSEHIGKIVLVP